MAKKLGKALLFTAVAGAIAAGGVALYNKYKASTDDFDDDFLDFDDEDDDFDDYTDDSDDSNDSDDDFDKEDSADKVDDSLNREYVSIPREEKTDDSTKDASDYKVNVDVSIDTSNFKDEDEVEADDTAEVKNEL